ncbi:hypothetical protein [Corynebacterium sp. HMSC074A01]|uniref:hypothetical protein n=1 Tax=Corynebacterium sp. HMSC074A01 TaxID=1715030 RepID=UPI00114C9367|nr:hypothetical protein [Corynebacterium sp. HMSC074A01]
MTKLDPQLEQYRSKEYGNCFVVIKNLEDQVDLSLIENGSMITQDVALIDLAAVVGYSRMIVVNGEREAIERVLDSHNNAGADCVEVWVDKSQPSLVVEVFTVDDAWAILGCEVDDSWVKFYLTNSTPEDRGSEDIRELFGMLLEGGVQADEQRVVAAAQGTLNEFSLRAVLIAKAVKQAKPVKKFLPHWAVHVSYKMLERFR